MTKCLVNAVSAKHGGARTIVESFVTASAAFPQHTFIVLAGFEPADDMPSNVRWRYLPKSGAAAMAFSLFFVFFLYFWHRADILISFNNVNSPLIPTSRRITYFHQLKALDPELSELKLRIIRYYLRHSREPVVLQSNEVKNAFKRMFGSQRHDLTVAWPGIEVPVLRARAHREQRTVLVPVASPQSPHKNFAFINLVAQNLGNDWKIFVTAPAGLIELVSEAANVEFIGVLSRADLFEQYRSATICLIASTHETIGLPIFEALAVGTHVVAYDAAYIQRFREHFGILEGLHIAKTPLDAVAIIESLAQNSEPRIEVERDFRKADWEKILNKI